jgi:hypothetical protein
LSCFTVSARLPPGDFTAYVAACAAGAERTSNAMAPRFQMPKIMPRTLRPGPRARNRLDRSMSLILWRREIH